MSIYLKIVSFIFPERCPYCYKKIEPEDIACEKCLKQIKGTRQPILRGAMGYRCVSSFPYRGNIKRLMRGIKFHDRVQHIRQVAVILADDIRNTYENEDFDIITFVPMHKIDLRERGYNQSELLAKELSKLLDIPCLSTLDKVKRTKKQHRLKFRERRKNLRGAFKVIDKSAVCGKKILIIDDIVTSGNTLGCCCNTLNKTKPELLCCATVANVFAYYDDYIPKYGGKADYYS